MSKYGGRVQVGLSGGTKMEFDTDLSPIEIYKSVDSKGFIDQSIVIFKLSDVSYILDTDEFGDDEFTKAELIVIDRMTKEFSEMCKKWNGANVFNTSAGIVDLDTLFKKMQY